MEFVVASRFDLPFYLRLPSRAYFSWDPASETAIVLPCQRLGQVSFARTTGLLPDTELLDSIAPASQPAGGHNVLMKCETVSGDELPTLAIDTSAAGGFTELRPFTEVTVFVVVASAADTEAGRQRARVMTVLNHFLNHYRLITQDPWVRPIDHELDLYLIVDTVGRIPDALRTATTADVLRALNTIPFAKEVGRWRSYTYRLNTLEDLFPGAILEEPFRGAFAEMVSVPYEVPLHYDLIFEAQGQLKRRNYHLGILEAETAFEVYVADLLVRMKTALGGSRDQILAEMDDPRRLQLLGKRLSALDRAATAHRQANGTAPWVQFIGSAEHAEWKTALYDVRNRVVHGGYRQVSFEEAKRGVVAGKAAIHALESQLPLFANRIQIYPGCDHVQNTAGRLRF